jgi:hypothetical protein
MRCSRNRQVDAFQFHGLGSSLLVVGSEQRLEAFQRNRVVVLHSRDSLVIRLNFRPQAPKRVRRKLAVLKIFSPLLDNMYKRLSTAEIKRLSNPTPTLSRQAKLSAQNATALRNWLNARAGATVPGWSSTAFGVMVSPRGLAYSPMCL